MNNTRKQSSNHKLCPLDRAFHCSSPEREHTRSPTFFLAKFCCEVVHNLRNHTKKQERFPRNSPNSGESGRYCHRPSQHAAITPLTLDFARTSSRFAMNGRRTSSDNSQSSRLTTSCGSGTVAKRATRTHKGQDRHRARML